MTTGTKHRYGASRNSGRSARSGTVSSLAMHLMPSASDCDQPCQPPTRIGPSRDWIWPAVLRSHQMAYMARSDTKASAPTTPITSRTTSHWNGQSSQAGVSSPNCSMPRRSFSRLIDSPACASLAATR